ncbi:response regulator transcription factor [Orrella sp. NBD-18]|uniref:Response regulator transcription factor n=1 Tax=Sheuella amnicola TaxID=2707330 RepID=A0A6B2R3W6_9BURK|nr:response regulator [Sheuella amnicola]NDY83747.1 response regulator transcription factor [Sheuella amnicola]HBI82302.1 DNA-binding response regulator [Alcaligenaceae bacterium]
MNERAGHIFLIDDDNSMRFSLSRMLVELGYSVQEFSSAREFLENSLPISPAAILLDMAMPDMTGLQLQEKLLEVGRQTPILFISGQSHPQQIVKGLKNGAFDFLFKPFNLEELINALNSAIQLDQNQLKKITSDIHARRRFDSLTAREKETCHLLVKGLSNKEIAQQLGITDATIKIHKARVLQKMQLDSIPTLVKVYFESDLNKDEG